VVTIVALVIRRKLNESPVFQDLEQQHAEPSKPVGEVFRPGRKPTPLVLFMNLGVTAQSYTYQVFLASYLVSPIGVDRVFVPKCCSPARSAAASAPSVRHAVRSFRSPPGYPATVVALVILPAPSFVLLDTRSPVAIVAVIVLGFILAGQGAVGVQMSYFPRAVRQPVPLRRGDHLVLRRSRWRSRRWSARRCSVRSVVRGCRWRCT
jgi:hypothetical protein